MDWGRRVGAGAITPSASDELAWVDGSPGHQHLVVEMRRRAAAGVAREPDALIELDALSGDHVEACEMAVAALDATPAIHRDDVALASAAAHRADDTRTALLHRRRSPGGTCGGPVHAERRRPPPKMTADDKGSREGSAARMSPASRVTRPSARRRWLSSWTYASSRSIGSRSPIGRDGPPTPSGA